MGLIKISECQAVNRWFNMKSVTCSHTFYDFLRSIKWCPASAFEIWLNPDARTNNGQCSAGGTDCDSTCWARAEQQREALGKRKERWPCFLSLHGRASEFDFWRDFDVILTPNMIFFRLHLLLQALRSSVNPLVRDGSFGFGSPTGPSTRPGLGSVWNTWSLAAWPGGEGFHDLAGMALGARWQPPIPFAKGGPTKIPWV